MSSEATLRLTLVGRRYCSLCDKMRVAVFEYARAGGIVLELADIDLDESPELEEKFGIRVPILMFGEFPTGQEICYYHFDDALFYAAYISQRVGDTGVGISS